MKSVQSFFFLLLASASSAVITNSISTPMITSLSEFKLFLEFKSSVFKKRTISDSPSLKGLTGAILCAMNELAEDISQIELHSLANIFDNEVFQDDFSEVAYSIVKALSIPSTDLLNHHRDETTELDFQGKLLEISKPWMALQTKVYLKHSKQVPFKFFPIISTFQLETKKMHKHAMRLYSTVYIVYPQFKDTSHEFLFKYYQYLMEKMAFIVDISHTDFEIDNELLDGGADDILNGILHMYVEMYSYFDKILRMSVYNIENGSQEIQIVERIMRFRIDNWDDSEVIVKRLLVKTLDNNVMDADNELDRMIE